VAEDDARLTGVVVPDDISSLDRDIAAYRKEVRRAQRARRRRQLLGRRGVAPALAITAAVALASVIAAMLTLLAPRAVVRPPAAAPLASPTQAPGSIGGLLPAATLRTQGGAPVKTGSETLRPQVFALIPPKCDCAALLSALSGQAYSENLRLAIIVPTATDDTADSLFTAIDRGMPSMYFDPQATIATAVASDGVTTVVVDRDGTIFNIERGITDAMSTSLDATLQSMLLHQRS